MVQLDIDEFIKLVSKGGRLQKESPTLAAIFKEKAKKRSKRKPTAYQKRYGAAYKKLKKQHPRMSFGSLSKKAHRKARR